MAEEGKVLGNSTVELMGTPFEFLEAAAEKYPLGLQVHFTPVGAIAPVRTGFMAPGSAILYMQPDVAQQFKAAVPASRG